MIRLWIICEYCEDFKIGTHHPNSSMCCVAKLSQLMSQLGLSTNNPFHSMLDHHASAMVGLCWFYMPVLSKWLIPLDGSRPLVFFIANHPFEIAGCFFNWYTLFLVFLNTWNATIGDGSTPMNHLTGWMNSPWTPTILIWTELTVLFWPCHIAMFLDKL